MFALALALVAGVMICLKFHELFLTSQPISASCGASHFVKGSESLHEATYSGSCVVAARHFPIAVLAFACGGKFGGK